VRTFFEGRGVKILTVNANPVLDEVFNTVAPAVRHLFTDSAAQDSSSLPRRFLDG